MIFLKPAVRMCVGYFGGRIYPEVTVLPLKVINLPLNRGYRGTLT